ncbi:MAG: antibiotic biosynthesis monooxygenase, partial [Chloroflexi bacterium]|nr:antibiotic biosynthesis monooxygenase [Chloroflexota bacterium]
MRMVVSILTRKTRITDRSQWRSALEAVLPKLKAVLDGEAGFVSVEYLWSTDDPGAFAQITTWESPDDCPSHV